MTEISSSALARFERVALGPSHFGAGTTNANRAVKQFSRRLEKRAFHDGFAKGFIRTVAGGFAAG
jgi:hypothetical protein